MTTRFNYMSTGDALVPLVILIVPIIHFEISLYVGIIFFFLEATFQLRATSCSLCSSPSCSALLPSSLKTRTVRSWGVDKSACLLAVQRADVKHSGTGAGIPEPWCFLPQHIFSTEPSGTSLSSLKPLHYWSWAAEAIECRCGCSQEKGSLQLLPQ